MLMSPFMIIYYPYYHIKNLALTLIQISQISTNLLKSLKITTIHVSFLHRLVIVFVKYFKFTARLILQKIFVKLLKSLLHYRPHYCLLFALLLLHLFHVLVHTIYQICYRFLIRCSSSVHIDHQITHLQTRLKVK